MKQYILYPQGHKDKANVIGNRQEIIDEYKPIIEQAIKDYVVTKKAFYDDILDAIETLTPMTRLECLAVLKEVDEEWHPSKFSKDEEVIPEVIKKKGK